MHFDPCTHLSQASVNKETEWPDPPLCYSLASVLWCSCLQTDISMQGTWLMEGKWYSRHGKGPPRTYSLRVTCREFYICVPLVATDKQEHAPCIMDEVEKMEAKRRKWWRSYPTDGITEEWSLAPLLCVHHHSLALALSIRAHLRDSGKHIVTPWLAHINTHWLTWYLHRKLAFRP